MESYRYRAAACEVKTSATTVWLRTECGNDWMPITVALAGLSIFAQMNTVFDLAIAAAYFISWFWLFNKMEFISIYAVLGIFAPRLYLYTNGPSLISVFLLLYVVRMVVKKAPFSVGIVAGSFFILMGLHGVMSVFPAKGVMVFLNYGIILLVTVSLRGSLSRPSLFRVFMVSWAIGAVGAGLYGHINPVAVRSSEISAVMGEFVRFKGVLADPNYMGLVLIVGILGAQLTGTMAVRWVLSSILLIFIAQTGSLTAVVSLLACAGVLLVLRRPANPTRLRFLLLLLFGLLGAVVTWRQWVSLVTDSEPVKFLWDRIVNEGRTIQVEDSSIASGRAQIAENYLDYFWHQDPLRLLFGGNVEGVYGLSEALANALGSAAMPHNFQIELLINLGLVGWILFTGVALGGLARSITSNARAPSAPLRILVAVKIVLFVYSLSLSMYPNWWFMSILLVTPLCNLITPPNHGRVRP